MRQLQRVMYWYGISLLNTLMQAYFSCPPSLVPPGVLPYKKRRKMERGQDPLKAGFVRAPKRGGDIGEPLTEMEAAAEKTRRKAARKQGGSGAFTAKRNVRKHQHIRR